MKFLANENMPGDAVVALRAAGHDVVWCVEHTRGVADETVLADALRDQRVLLTFDKDFGELVFRRGHTASGGVVLFRLRTRTSDEAARRVLSVIVGHADQLSGHFTVATDDRIRIMALP